MYKNYKCGFILIPLFAGGIVNRPVRYGAPVQASSLCEYFSFKQFDLSKLNTRIL